MFRDPNKDNKMKSIAVVRRQQEENKLCVMPDCNQPLTVYKGPGSDSLCRPHQQDCREYGGFLNPSEPHTGNRGWECEECGYDPRKDPRFDKITDPVTKYKAMRSVMHGDHIIPKALGGSDAKENIRTLCPSCHWIKSWVNGDFANKTKKKK